MPHSAEALRQIRIALNALETARNELSAALVKRSGDTKSSEYKDLEALHGRVTRAAACLPHGGER